MNQIVYPQKVIAPVTFNIVTAEVNLITGECIIGLSESGPAVQFVKATLSTLELESIQSIINGALTRAEPGVTIQAVAESLPL